MEDVTKTTDPVNECYKALAAAQMCFPQIPKDATNPHFRSKYTTLETLIRATRGALCEHGLAVSQTFDDVDGEPVLITKLVHSSGGRIESRLRLRCDKTNMQALGSATTYARRYALAAILGVASEEDDDGNGAVSSGNPYKDRQQAREQRQHNDAKAQQEPPIERAKKKIASVERCEELTDMFLQCKDNEKLQADHALFREICIEIGAEIEKRVNAKKWSLEGECTTLMQSLKGEIEMIDTIEETKEAFGDE